MRKSQVRALARLGTSVPLKPACHPVFVPKEGWEGLLGRCSECHNAFPVKRVENGGLVLDREAYALG